jgi:hypothetical protein
MPLLAISVPPAFERQWPEKVVNLEANQVREDRERVPDRENGSAFITTHQNRLLSNFDLYQTLVDILLLSASHRPRRLSMAIQGMRQKQPGLSLFGPVPRQRSCADSRIPHQFCCCMEQGGASDDDAINRLDINSLQVGTFFTGRFTGLQDKSIILNCWRSYILNGETFKIG